MIKQQVNQILAKEVDRKDFLKHVGVAILAVAGVSTVLSRLGSIQPANGGGKGVNGISGYGMSAYGR